MQDGGYYAIKGFEYQVDKTIFEILNSENEDDDIYIEKLEDINSDSYVIQVKYKETQKFVPSSIKKPIISLFKEFKKEPEREYILYCFFKDFGSYSGDTLKLEQILGNAKNDYSTNDRKEFEDKLKIIFAQDYKNQFYSVIQKLQDEKIANNQDEAIIFYANIVDYLRKLVIYNPKGQEDKRRCSKREILTFVQNNKLTIFNSSLLEFQGRHKYFQHIKKNFIKPRMNSDNIIVFGKTKESINLNIEELILELINTYYNKATHDIKPLTFILNEKNAKRVKLHLIENDILFNDGYETLKFNTQAFWRMPIKNRKVTKNRKATDSLGKISFKIRLISKKSFDTISSSEIEPNKFYLFDSELNNDTWKTSLIKIDKLETSEILKLFK